MAHAKNFKDITGQRFGRLIVLQLQEIRQLSVHARAAFWLCQCDCGHTKIILGQNLRNGKTRSCGCLQPEIVSGRYKKFTKHPLWAIWTNMLQRCKSVNHPSYHNYGGRGIFVVDAWQSFEQFIQDVGDRPTSQHTLDRIDNNGPYGPGNTRWATRAEQRRNARHAHLITFLDQTLCVTDWSKVTGIPRPTLSDRLRRGWSDERTLTTPLKAKYLKDRMPS